MLDRSLDPSDDGVLEVARLSLPFLSDCDLAELASMSLRNCSLFMVMVLRIRGIAIPCRPLLGNVFVSGNYLGTKYF